MSITVMKQALEALNLCPKEILFAKELKQLQSATTSLRKAIAEAQEQERNFCERCGKRLSKDAYHIHTCTPPHSPQRQWVELTDEEILKVWCIHLEEGDEDEIEEWRHVIDEARMIEAKLKEKNT